jgi:hypothetical protein
MVVSGNLAFLLMFVIAEDGLCFSRIAGAGVGLQHWMDGGVITFLIFF